jgi:hypothetical protein
MTAITVMIMMTAVAMRMFGQVLVALAPKDGQHRRGQDHRAGDAPDQVSGDHQPAGEEPQVGVDGPADPLERGAAVGVPQVQPPVGIGDDQHAVRYNTMVCALP